MTAPDQVESGPATAEAVAAWLSANLPGFDDDAQHINAVVPAVNSWIKSFQTPLLAADGSRYWPEHVVHGAVMLAARNVRRRNSPAGVETAGDGTSVYVARYDRDLDSLLGLGAYRDLVVG